MTAEHRESLLARLGQAYAHGMHSTGSIGLVADMLYAMGTVANAYGRRPVAANRAEDYRPQEPPEPWRVLGAQS